MTADKPSKRPSMTVTHEYGYHIRKKYRYGKKRRQKTTKIEKNTKKVVLAEINGLQVYVYPKEFPNKVFLGIFPMSIQLEEADFSRLFGIMNKIRWYFNEDWVRKGDSRNKAKYLRQQIQRAYTEGLNELKGRRKDPASLN